MSLRELFREFAVAKIQLDERRGHRHTETHQQSPAEQAAMWQVIATRFGGTFTPIDPDKVTRGH